MTLEERLQELYPVCEPFTEKNKDYLKEVGMKPSDIEALESRLNYANIINKQLRDAYLLGRKERNDYEDL